MIKIDKKMKSRFKIFGIGFLINIILTALLSTYVFNMISKIQISFVSFLPHNIIFSMINNKIHFMMYISFLLMSIMVIFLIINNGTSESFASELDEITETIKTPKSVGQSQHGSARWLKSNEYDNIFSSYDVTNENKLIDNLVEGGLIDRGQARVKEKLTDLENSNCSTENEINSSNPL